MTDPIELMARALAKHDGWRDDAIIGGGNDQPMWNRYSKCAGLALEALTASGYVIMTITERDGIRAAAMAEAANRVKRFANGGDYADAHDTRLCDHLAEAILALAKAPAGMVCVPVDEVADLKSSVVAFGCVHAVQWAKEIGLPKDHLLDQHYDLLEKCGARMIDFKRYDRAMTATHKEE